MNEVTWLRSSFCEAGQCVEVSSGWVRAACDTSACVEVRPSLVFEDTVVLRSSAHPQSVLPVSREEWAAFVAGVKRGEFDDI